MGIINALYSWMKNIIIFLILVTVIFNLLGKSNYKKYVGLVTGLILVLLVITPIITLFGKEDILNFSLNSHGTLVQAEDISDELFRMEKLSEDSMFSEYKEVIRGQTIKLLSEKGLVLRSMKIEINTDKDSLNFGEILGMEIEASYLKTSEITKEGEKTGVDKIDPVTIGQIKVDSNEGEKQEKQQISLSPMEINIKNVLADFYNVDSSNINISIQEDHDGEKH